VLTCKQPWLPSLAPLKKKQKEEEEEEEGPYYFVICP
jgi:hypothetical protein